MATLLHIDCSPMREESITRALSREFVRRWRETNPLGRVIARDLARGGIPLIDAAWVEANLTANEARTAWQHEMLRLSAELVQELREADEYVMGIPMHNCGPPAAFKLWVDHIVTPLVRSGPLEKKRVTFLLATGSAYRAGVQNACKYLLEAWLRTTFGYLGIDDVRFVIADGAAAMRHRGVARSIFLRPFIEEVEEFFSAASAPG